MLAIGLTGGIGSGKSTVADALADRGAVVVDADAITRRLQQPGQAVFDAIVEEFGPGVVDAAGGLDRPALAERIFSDPEAKAAMEAIVHPAVGAVIAERLAELAPTDAVAVLDIPLLVESGRAPVDAVLVVDTDPELAVARLVEHRGFAESDARARMANQASRSQRLAAADFVVVNDGTPAELEAEVERAWVWIQSLRTAERTA
jgi:dephospho-CoA kinase